MVFLIPYVPRVLGHLIYILTILVLEFEIVHSTTRSCSENIAVGIANNVDPDQTPYSESRLFAKDYLFRYIGLFNTVNANELCCPNEQEMCNAQK